MSFSDLFKKNPNANVGSLNRRSDAFLKSFSRGRKKQVLYAQGVRRPIVGSGGGRRGAGPGRPKGSYAAKYAAYGGVYEYRKRLNAQLRLQRIQALRNAAVSPQQQQVLAQIEARNQAQAQAPENRAIPDTTGRMPLRSIHDEIDDAANIFP